MSQVILIKKHITCTVDTMSKGCRNQIESYILSNIDDVVITSDVEDTKKSIMNLPNFKSGCFTYLQALSFARFYSSRVCVEVSK